MRNVLSAICLIAAVLGGAVTAAHTEPVKIRISWVVVPAELTPIMFAPPGIARHEGSSYVVEHMHFSGGPLAVAAFAAGDVDMAGFGYVTIASAIQGAGLDDLRVIADVDQDGVEGWHTNSYTVRNDAPIRTVEDLKGRVAAINIKGGLTDIPLRAMLRKHGLDDEKDVTIIEIAPPNMKAMLLEGKVDLVGMVPPFAMDSQLRANTRVLFTSYEAAGRQQVSTLVARAGFIAKNRAALVDFLEDYIRAVRWYIDPVNHRDAVQIVANFMKRPVALFDSWAFTHADQYRNPDAIPDPSLLQANIDAMRNLGFIKGEIDMARHTDPSLAREAAARLPR